MTKSVFAEWFHKKFVPLVDTFHKKQKLPNKALLLLDNCPGQPNEDDLKSKNSFIRVMFLPRNVTPLLQPMGQNVIQTVKMQYKKKPAVQDFVYRLQCDQILKRNQFKEYGLLSCKCLGKQQYKKKAAQNEKHDDEESIGGELNQLRDTIAEKLVDTADDLTTDDVSKWLAGGEEENNQFLTDDDIIEEVMTEEEKEEEDEEEAMDSFTTSIIWAEENGVSASDILFFQVGLNPRVTCYLTWSMGMLTNWLAYRVRGLGFRVIYAGS
ncbi:hypothetical protein KPH14_012193 [Odynerus spinipes]|uniref:DDE-1 domain-containing protein n=1 Tax=Odynerus spinipes TaxID=1348599 RepID=A0AAD9VLD9_9HYME|nr:hypothetical protein KPH14_012193 [Odynerus spinipes]